MVPTMLQFYHDSCGSGEHDRFWRTYWKLTQRFTWKNIKDDVANYERMCHVCQINKAKYRPRGDEMVMLEYSDIPFKTIHLDFAEIKKAGQRKTQAFLIAIDECTHIVTAKAGREGTNSVISLME